MTSPASHHPDVSSINWFHTIDLGNGIVTPGDDDSPAKLKQLSFPKNLSGKTFLDIGAWDGFFSFEAERRGASRVLATDSYVWQGNVPGKSKEGFLTARQALGSKVEDMEVDALNISPDRVGMWDVVFLAGVIYHVKHPWLCLQRAASVTRQMLIVETLTDMRFCLRPAMALFSPVNKNCDPNWTAPNIKALSAMLRDCGFSKIDIVFSTGLLRAIGSAVRQGSISAIQQGRCAVHAFR
jgi:tRNA (mo5U34)-methyltransferase